MLDLILLRHSKAVAAAAGDHARELAPRGLAEAHEAGVALARLAPPDFALVSDARRTHETFERIVEAAGHAIAHRLEPGLYGATPEAILAAIAGAPPDCRRLLVVGHNPGIGDLARRLAGTGAGAAAAQMDAHFPTSAFAVIGLAGAGWAAAKAGGQLKAYRPPEAWLDTP